MMSASFIDSNVLVYLADIRDRRKQSVAKELVKASIERHLNCWISTQTLTEFINVALKKLKLPTDVVEGFLRFFDALPIVDMDRSLVRRGLEIRARYHLQYYDSVIIAAAERCGATCIYSEDLNDGQLYCGIQVVNPFA